MTTESQNPEVMAAMLPTNQTTASLAVNDPAVLHLVQLNNLLVSQLSKLQSVLAVQTAQPLKAALERKRLNVIAACPPIGKDMLVQFKTGGEYTTTDTNVVKRALTPLLAQYGISYQCTPAKHDVTQLANGSYLYQVALQFSVTDCETGYTEMVPGDWFGIWIGSLDKGYASAITNGIGKFLISYFSIACFDRPDELAADSSGNTVTIRERKKSTAANHTQPETEKQLSKAELDYGKCKVLFSAIKTAEEVKTRYEAMLKGSPVPYDKVAMKRAFIERYYQIVDLDLNDEAQLKFITDNWKGTLYMPAGKQQHYRLYVLDAEIIVRNQETVENLKKLVKFKVEK